MKRFFLVVGFCICISSIYLMPVTAEARLVPIECTDPQHCGTCEFVKLINNVIDFGLVIASSGAVLLFIFAGFKLLFSGGNSGAAGEARNILTNVVVGYIIILASFLIIDTIMSAFLPAGHGALGWKTVQCLYPGDLHETEREPSSVEIGGGGGGGGGKLSQCPPDNVGCSVNALQSAGFSSQQANIMSCIAMTESSGNPSAWSPTNACGTFQVVGTTWRSAATGACANFSMCKNAACNIQVTKTLVDRNGFRDWTCPGCNIKAQQCINKYQ